MQLVVKFNNTEYLRRRLTNIDDTAYVVNVMDYKEQYRIVRSHNPNLPWLSYGYDFLIISKEGDEDTTIIMEK